MKLFLLFLLSYCEHCKRHNADNGHLRNISFHVIIKLQIKFENCEVNMGGQLPYSSKISTKCYQNIEVCIEH